MIHTVIKFGALAFVTFCFIFAVVDTCMRIRDWVARRRAGALLPEPARPEPAFLGAPPAEPYAAERRYLDGPEPDEDWTAEIDPRLDEEWPPDDVFADLEEPWEDPREHPQTVPWDDPERMHADLEQAWRDAWESGQGTFEPVAYQFGPCPECGGPHTGMCRPWSTITATFTGQPVPAPADVPTAIAGFTRYAVDPVLEEMWSDAPIGRMVLENHPEAIGAPAGPPARGFDAAPGETTMEIGLHVEPLTGALLLDGEEVPGRYDEDVRDWYDEAGRAAERHMRDDLMSARARSARELAVFPMVTAAALN